LTIALGQVIKDRAGRAVTNRQIAAHVGVHPTQIGRYLSGVKSPTLEEIRLMSEAVGADWLDVLNEAHALVAGATPLSGEDPRTLIQFLMTHPDEDGVLQARLGELRRDSGSSGRTLASVEREMVLNRRSELGRALEALPPAQAN
jgi:transcriptional regulator with XRE-family HTH domain